MSSQESTEVACGSNFNGNPLDQVRDARKARRGQVAAYTFLKKPHFVEPGS